MDNSKFFARIRAPLFGKMSPDQVAGVESILKGWEAAGGGRRQHLSYMLATTFHETAKTMQPINEMGGNAYFAKKYDPPAKVAKQLGNTKKGDGPLFHGRGYVQLTGRANYKRAAKECGGDFIENPDLALKPDHAFDIMYRGMSQGWFTGKKLSDYLYAGHTDFLGSRKIINGTDKAALIAGYAEHFDDAILLAVA